METGKVNYNIIGYALRQLPRKIQIKIVIGCLKEKNLDFMETYYTYCFLIFKSSLNSKDRCYIYNRQNRLLKPKLKKFYLERCKCNHFELMKMLRRGYYPLVVLDNIAKHNGSKKGKEE